MSYLNIIKVPSDEEYCTRSSVIITDITDTPDLDSSTSNSNMTNINGIDTSSVELVLFLYIFKFNVCKNIR